MNQYIIFNNTTILETIKKLNNPSNNEKTLFVIDSKKRLIGSVTDGDIRRGFIKQISTLDKVSKIMKKNPIVYKSFKKTNKRIKRDGIKFGPILNKQKQIVRFVNFNKYQDLRKTNIVIMAGGKGERLYPLTKKIPKPIIKINGKSHLTSLISELIERGTENIIVSTNYKSNKIINDLKWINNKNVKIIFLKEKKYLGTAGPLSLINIKNNFPYLIINGDIHTSVNFKSILEEHKNSGSKVSICVKYEKNKIPFAVIKQKKGKVTNIIEKPVTDNLSSIGIYVLNKTILKKIPKNNFLQMPDFLQGLLKENIDINCCYVYEKWKDFGTINNLAELDAKYSKYLK
jgi:dTDP-glucose pyrophosphorylase